MEEVLKVKIDPGADVGSFIGPYILTSTIVPRGVRGTKEEN